MLAVRIRVSLLVAADVADAAPDAAGHHLEPLGAASDFYFRICAARLRGVDCLCVDCRIAIHCLSTRDFRITSGTRRAHMLRTRQAFLARESCLAPGTDAHTSSDALCQGRSAARALRADPIKGCGGARRHEGMHACLHACANASMTAACMHACTHART